MAGAGAYLWEAGEVVTAANLNQFTQDQVVAVYADATARDAAYGGSGEPVLAEGMFCFLKDSDTLQYYDGSDWEIFNPNTNENVVINGAMQVHQRGTSTASITGSGYFTADRFITAVGSMGTFTQTVENDAPTGSGFRKSLKMLCTTADASPAAADVVQIQHRIEGQNLQQFCKGTADAKQYTLSFYVKASLTGTYIAELFDVDNTRQVSAAYTVVASNTWEEKTITFPADTTGEFDNDNASSLFCTFHLGAGSDLTSGTLNTVWAANVNANRAVGQTNVAGATNRTWQVTGVKLEVGGQATPFPFEDISTTIDKCQRYFSKSYNLTTVPGTSTQVGLQAGELGLDGNFEHMFTVRFTTRMRATPTVTGFSNLSGAAGNWRVFNNGRTLNADAAVSLVGQSETGATFVIAFNGSNMQGHYRADAEL